MKKSAVLVLIIVFCHFCSLFRAKIAPYPSGVVFPVEKDHEFSYKGEIISLIQTQNHLLYFSTRKGKVYCIDGQKQEMLWRFDISASFASPPSLSESGIYIYDDENILYCIARDGKLQWKTKLSDKITSGIAESEGQVFLGTEKGQLYSLSAETGEELWQVQADDAIQSNLIIWQENVVFGCDDHSLYFVNKKGKLSGKHDAGGRIGKTLTVDENLLFFGTEDRYLHCVNLNRQKTKWKIRSGGATFVTPAVARNRVFFLCWNCILYCLNKKNGTILWWNSVPSRSYYQVEVIEDKVVASSFSPELVCFDIRTGERKGAFKASQEIKSNPVWFSPFLLASLHDPESETGKLIFLKKVVKAILSPSVKPPYKQNEEIIFNTRAYGFHLPKFEFFLTRYIQAKFYPDIFLLFREGDREVVQESSEALSWSWFPEEEGYFEVEVVVVDEKEKAQAKLPILIQKERITLSLSSSLESPQKIGQKIVFTADFAGFDTPRFEFRLSRWKWVSIPSEILLLIGENEEVVQETSEENSWTWTPESEGLYMIKVIAQDGQETSTAQMTFVIPKE